MSPDRGTMFDSLRVRNYRLFFTGQIISLTGTWMQTVAQDWLVLDLSGNSGTALGAVVALQFLPMMIFTAYAGLLADRLDKRTVLLAVQGGMGLLALGMGLLVVSGAARMWHVFVFAGLWGLLQAFDTPTRQAFVSELVGPERLPNAVSLNSATFNSARLVGPAVGGLLIAAVDVGPAFLINAVTFIAVLSALAMMRPEELTRGTPLVKGKGQIRDALRHVRADPDLLRTFALVFVVGTMGMNFMLTLPLLAKVEFEVGAAQFGLLSAAFAAGALTGALIGTRRRGRPSGRTHLALAIMFGVLEIAVAATPNLVVAMLVLIPTGAFLIMHNNVANARVQLGVPDHLRGRVMALYVLVFIGGTPVGSLIVGAISEHFGAGAGLVTGGASVLVTAAVLAGLRVRHFGTWRLALAGPGRRTTGIVVTPCAHACDHPPRHGRRRPRTHSPARGDARVDGDRRRPR